MEVQKIPKNIRQIGGIEDWIKVYVEDYVVTYVHRLNTQGNAGMRWGVLLGKKERSGQAVYLFLSGAMEVDETTISQDGGQARLEAEISQRFPGTQVWGWFLCDGDGHETSLDKVEQIYRLYFRKEYQVLFWQREQEADFFVFAGRGLERLKGYHIYYERNEEMQEYMILSSPQFRSEPEKPAEAVVENYRKLMQKRQQEPVKPAERRRYGFVHAASLVCVFLMGVMAFYGRRDMQASALVETQSVAAYGSTRSGQAAALVREVPANLETTRPVETQPVETQPPQTQPAETQPPQTQQVETQPAGTQSAETQSPETQPPETQPPETQPPETEAQAAAIPERYTVKRGDTLQKISIEIYGNDTMIQAICEENDISDPNYLFAGQVLRLP